MGKKQHKQHVLRYELTGLGLLALAALALGRLGIVGRSIDVAFIYLTGSWSFLVPLFIGYAAVYIMIQRSAFPWNSRHMGLLILFLSLLTYLEMWFFQQVLPYYQGNPPLFHVTLTAVKNMGVAVLHPAKAPPGSVSGAGGGLVGYALFSVFYKLFGGPGAHLLGVKVMLVFVVIIGAALLTQQSLVAGIQRGTSWMEKRLDSLWTGSKQYIDVLFGAGDSGRKDKKSEGKKSAKKRSAPDRGRDKSAGLVLDAEWSESHHSEVETPVVRDFAAGAGDTSGVEEQTSSDAPDAAKGHLQQVGNQLTMKFPDAPSSRPKDAPVKSAKKATEEGPIEPYTVGVPVRDENYRLPSVRMLSVPKGGRSGFDHKSAQENARKLEQTLESFGVKAKVLEISRGPTVTRYELQPAIGVKVSRVVNLTDDIALALAAQDIRVEAPVPGKSVIGIEVPNAEVSVVTLREVLESPEFTNGQSKLSLALGRDISGAAIVGDLQKMPHLLVAGATGSGKSVCINGIITAVLMKAKPHEVKFLMIDPKMVELSVYNGIPHLLAPVVTDPRKAAFALKKVIQEMESRYRSFAERGARDIERYNQMLRSDGLDELPYIVVIVDELADLMMVAPGDVEDAICRIAQMARAAGIHLIVATQRPSVDVITGVIKANIPSRIAFSVSSMADSRTILDSGGAEKLLGRGDMLYVPVGASKPTRVQGAFISEDEIERLVDYVKTQQDAVYTVDLNHVGETQEESAAAELDPLFSDAVDLVIDNGQASVSMIQRRFRVGYARAARIVDQMELQGMVGHFEGSKPREVLVAKEQWEQIKQGHPGDGPVSE
ncbi:DNA translocase FtsK [Alicyclobacillus sp. SO9]|uniref:FtsK/SpoIIIE family DNA translocase n=1 Tax=Alicyclobacillus sp. SO9 TaxID=2665646 RepID=UPI0018E71143|nr:DNA translocase FtsK [Alicyclobacillus sp. SO9]QQE80864.1 cell division protein FtsK [Alicyclobacillus sp. SO9]